MAIKVDGDPCPHFGETISPKPELARGVTSGVTSGVTRGVTPSNKEKRKGDRHKGGQAEYMRAYRARKRSK